MELGDCFRTNIISTILYKELEDNMGSYLYSLSPLVLKLRMYDTEFFRGGGVYYRLRMMQEWRRNIDEK